MFTFSCAIEFPWGIILSQESLITNVSCYLMSFKYQKIRFCWRKRGEPNLHGFNFLLQMTVWEFRIP